MKSKLTVANTVNLTISKKQALEKTKPMTKHLNAYSEFGVFNSEKIHISPVDNFTEPKSVTV